VIDGFVLDVVHAAEQGVAVEVAGGGRIGRAGDAERGLLAKKLRILPRRSAPGTNVVIKKNIFAKKLGKIVFFESKYCRFLFKS
jgi:hypothetical protein